MMVSGRVWRSWADQASGGLDPLGLEGLLCWYGLYPIHWLIFRRMLRGISARGESEGQPQNA